MKRGLEHGGDIYSRPVELDFSVNINPNGLPEGVKAVLYQDLEALCSAYPDPCCRALREALAEQEGVSAREILCANGASELLYAAARAQMKLCAGQSEGGKCLPALRALLCAPSFSEYEKALRAVGAQVRFFSLWEEERGENEFALTEGFLEELEVGTDLVFLCNPGNPSGKLIGQELLERVVRICHQKRIRLVLDESFLDFTGEEEARSGKRCLRGCPELFVVKAFTKKYAMPGLRLGYGMSADTEFLNQMRAVLPEWNVSSLAQAAGTAALREKEYWERSLQLIRTERPFLQKELEALGCRVFPSDANFLLFRCSRPDLKERLLEQGFLIRDCSNYRGLKKGFYRVAVKRREENVRLLTALGRIFAEDETE